MKQNEIVLEHLKEHGSITPLEAMERYGIMRLSARVWDLRHDYGLNIKAETAKGRNRNGEKTSFARYSLMEE